MLVSCLYASRPTAPLTRATLDAILQQSRRNNPAQGLTGLLCHTDDLFVQVLEGGRGAVSERYNAIARDERHADVCLLAYDEIATRRFSGWTMGQVNIGDINTALLLKYFERPTLDPFSASGSATMAFLTELIASGAIANRAAG